MEIICIVFALKFLAQLQFPATFTILSYLSYEQLNYGLLYQPIFFSGRAKQKQRPLAQSKMFRRLVSVGGITKARSFTFFTTSLLSKTLIRIDPKGKRFLSAMDLVKLAHALGFPACQCCIVDSGGALQIYHEFFIIYIFFI